jgi:glycolate oxidase iron-sulfur subunit
VVINTSGCGTTVKDYGHIFAGNDPNGERTRPGSAPWRATSPRFWRDRAACGAGRGALRSPITPPVRCNTGSRSGRPEGLAETRGFEVVEPADSHLCCGSAGTYNLMQPEISGQLRDRKVATLEAKAPQVIARAISAA